MIVEGGVYTTTATSERSVREAVSKPTVEDQEVSQESSNNTGGDTVTLSAAAIAQAPNVPPAGDLSDVTETESATRTAEEPVEPVPNGEPTGAPLDVYA